MSVSMSPNLTCVDLFCGAGGFSLGFRRAGFEILAAVDQNEMALETYRHNFPDVTLLGRNIQDISASDIASEGGFTVDDVDVVIGGPPCKGFSNAGRMDPSDQRNTLVGNYLSMVKKFNPDVVVMENVLGMLHMSEGRYRDLIIRELQNLGYKINTHHEVMAADYGVPQLRERVLFMGTKKQNPLSPPAPTHFDPEDDEVLSSTKKQLEPYVSVREAISDLAFLDVGEKSNQYQNPRDSMYQEQMRANTKNLYNHQAPNHGDRVQQRFSLLEPGQRMSDLPNDKQTAKHSLYRFDPDRPSYTITTLPEDFVHYCRNRIPTVREVARIQSFPDDFEFKGPRTTGGRRRKEACPQYSQVGNAVPPLLAEVIARKTISHINESEDPAIKASAD